ncbi:hypothetical protein AiwAL_02990 [Acidiphilium sp. AL]|uniref:Lipoprotein n=1 Tax=Acidiphilium iwatense TaxID=768198 RepID=A0ABS9DTJ7_9PROT|nr:MULTISPECIES: hypothetical protein [Acidiphilium]MCF3946051.1 hypothetical protein [Acidiphilium iwatense]MCU4159068.1 hypothetical protein [Acidiphilium sp. AL]
MNALPRILAVASLGLLAACADGNSNLVSKFNAAYGTSFPAGAQSHIGLAANQS